MTKKKIRSENTTVMYNKIVVDRKNFISNKKAPTSDDDDILLC